MKVLVIDTETNGREPVPEIVELAYAEPGGPAQAERFKPNHPSTWGALAVHHILAEELEGCRPSLEAKLPKECEYIIGHNVDYDWGALGKPPVKRICTLAIARTLYPEMDSHRLGAMYYRLFGGDPITRAVVKGGHSAADDVAMCYDILCAMLLDRAPQVDNNDVVALYAFSEDCRLPRVISFGKHKGTQLLDLPKDYVAWIYRQPDMDPYLVAALRKFRGGR